MKFLQKTGLMVDQDKLIKYQGYLLEMLVDFRDYCSENGLTWFLAGGSALGAVRHNSFIPWDDDVDLAMPREDFEKLEKLLSQSSDHLKKYLYSPVEAQLIPDAPIGHLYHTEAAEGKIEYAPKLDIHPLDGVPDDAGARKKQKMQSMIYYLGVYHHPTKNKGSVMKFITRVVLWIIPKAGWKKIIRKTKQFFTSFSCSECSEIVSIFGSAGYEKETVPRGWLLEPEETQFCGQTMPIPAQAEKYLERLYGDWRQLPPEADRHPLHDSYKYL